MQTTKPGWVRAGLPESRRFLARTLFAAVVLLTAGGLPGAQEQEAGPRFAGPLAVQDAFFEAMKESDSGAAARTFPDDAFANRARAEAAARTLYQDVFLRLDRVSVSSVFPETFAGAEFTFDWPLPDGAGTIPIVYRRVADGGFRFSEDTLYAIQDHAEELADLGVSAAMSAELSALENLHLALRRRLPDGLLSQGLLIENWQWLGLFFLVLVAVVVDRLVRFLAQRVANRLTRGENVRLDRETLGSFQRPLGLVAGVLTFEFLLPVLGVDAGILSVLLLATSVVSAVAGIWAFYRLVDVFTDYLSEKSRRTASKFDDMLVPLLRRTLKLFVLVVGLLFVASRMSEDLWGIVAGLSLGTFALGFAAKDSVENLFGTFTVLMDKPFQIGDWIISGDLEGTVELVGFRSTRIRTFYNSVITVPNSRFISSAVDNMGERRYRRIRTTLGLTYDTPPEKIEAFCEGVRELIRSHPYTRKDYYHVYLNGFGASSLDVMLYAFVETPEWATELREKHRLFADILRLAEKLGVSFAFPTQTVHLAKPEDLHHHDRPADDGAGAERGRETAHGIVERTLEPFGGQGSVPPPVEILTRPVYGDDGADGG